MLINILVALWGAVVFTMYFIEFTQMPQRIRIRGWLPFNRKPFNCEACLPFWLFAVFVVINIYGYEWVACLAGACTAGIITPIILKAIRK